MLTDEESRLLYWLARDYADGSGEICDLGCFTGGSTARLAAGVLDADRLTPVHGYDHFQIKEPQKKTYLYPSGVAPFQGEDMLPAATSLLSPWKPVVQLHAGDICRTHWTGAPIELLFVDAAKTPRSADAIARKFYPSMIPNRSVLIQQDYLHWRQPWIPAQMELLGDMLELVAWCKVGTAAFRPTRAIGQDDLTRALTANLSDDDMIDLIRLAMRRFQRRVPRAQLATSILAIRDNPGVRAAFKMSRSRFSPARVKTVLNAA